jgi:predicted O-methyltransferase YrrM
MEFLDPELEAYVEAHTQAESELLHELNRQTHMKVLQPRMLSGHLQGRVLSMLSQLHRPKRILEIGTYTGYSAISLAEGLDEGGKLFTIDINEGREPMVKEDSRKAGKEDKIEFMIGEALKLIPKIEGEFDLVFIDADKENYSAYFDAVIDRMPLGGLLIADNVLWSRKVLDPKELENDLDTRSLHAFNQKIQNDERVMNVLFPIRDGLMIARKIK